MADPIRLKAESINDLKVISSLLQDAALRVDSMAYQPKRHRFALVANRFCWEDEKKGKALHRRVRSGLRFEGVLRAGFKNIPRGKKDRVVSLLAIEAAKTGEDFTITLVFSGAGAIRLGAEVVEVYLEDMTGPWPTRNRPEHPVAGKP